jgi:hypothetical protein
MKNYRGTHYLNIIKYIFFYNFDRENKNLSEDLDSTNTTIVGDYVNRIQELKCKLDESNDLFKD